MSREYPFLDGGEVVTGCGMGQGAECCAYLCVGADGLECGRIQPAFKTRVEQRVAAGMFTARRLPDAPYPDCQLDRAAPDRPPGGRR